VREHLTRVINDYECHNVPGTASASLDAHYLALPITATVRLPESAPDSRMVINCVQLFRFGDDDLIKEVKCFWGLTDVTPATDE
jgi:steroid delta-isomerase